MAARNPADPVNLSRACAVVSMTNAPGIARRNFSAPYGAAGLGAPSPLL
jgi:hypothetical protein